MTFAGGGTNPAHGRDPATMLAVPPPYYPVPGGLGQPPGMMYCNPYLPPLLPPPYTQNAAAAARPQACPALGTTIAVGPNGQLYQYISGLNNSNRLPCPPPVVDPDFPAANHINSTGGAGVEPGFNYFFPTEHAKVIVLKCTVPPWTLGAGSYSDTVMPFHAAVVPAGVTMAELLVGFGATNPDKGRNQFWECYPQGGGAWGWREHVTGDDEVMMARTVRDMGWVEKRDGCARTVYLWISKG
ncbi:hypothetical protein N658DRAFT_468933 [Parathielavia hyrcaniae]|uniref:Uncharacterized protein n=1 Tax=Parathielavia hyrcaniae TaxID=113614 RepID=A0AAN6Q2K5_9PEZI|nr:hypothetical protein N658DRAFT_468933 [Parathielavia hyrcaniae]